MADPLLTLRASIKSSTSIIYTDASGAPTTSLASASHIVLAPGRSFPKSTPTRFRSSPTEQTFWRLDALYVAWFLRAAPAAEYMRQAREHGLAVGFVSVMERKGVVDWLEGRTENHERIVPLEGESTTPPGSPSAPKTGLATSASSKRPATENTTTPSTKRKYVPDAADIAVVKKIRANEVELADRISVLRGTKESNFSSIRQAFSDRMKKLREASKAGVVAPSVPAIDPKMQARKAKHMYPIIMISSSPTSLVTMHNVKRFLEEAVFEAPTEARARAIAEGNPRAEDMIPIYRKNARYHVIDGVEALSKFGADAWDRVVCVMTTGQAWQFNKYQWKEPRELFHHVKGFYVCWSNDPPNPKIRDWNVTELKVSAHQRHLDKSVVARFWETLDAWTMANKPWLAKS